VIVLDGAPEVPVDESSIRQEVQTLRDGGASPRDVARMLTERHRVPRNLAYRLAHEHMAINEERHE
jgi:hypothetical protein